MFITVLLFSLMAVIFWVGSGLFAIYKPAGNAFRGIILHFAAGVVFSIVAVELLPDIMEKHLPLEVLIGFGSGIGLMFFVESFARKTPDKTPPVVENKLPASLLVAFTIDIAVDGLLLGTGFAAGQKQGTLLAIALAAELIALGLALTSELTNEKVSRQKITAIVLLLGLLFLIISVASAFLLNKVPLEILEIFLSFGLAALLYLAIEELLKEAHYIPEKPYMTLSFFIGFIVFVIIGMYA